MSIESRAEERRQIARRLALETMADASDIAACAVGGIHVGILLGLERDGLAEQLPERDRLGDRRFKITEAGRAFIAEGTA